jgi:hypothetical protein
VSHKLFFKADAMLGVDFIDKNQVDLLFSEKVIELNNYHLRLPVERLRKLSTP